MSNQLLKTFGLTVRHLREARHWSQEQLAEQANLNRCYVGEVERGQVAASIITIKKLATAYGLSGASLLDQCEKACLRDVSKWLHGSKTSV